MVVLAVICGAPPGTQTQGTFSLFHGGSRLAIRKPTLIAFPLMIIVRKKMCFLTRCPTLIPSVW